MRAIDETGNRYGALTVISFIKGKPKGKWLCKCDCGNEKLVFGSDLRKGKVTSCGCKINNSKIEKLGTQYGYLIVKERDPTPAKEFPDHSIHWLCYCQLCGSIVSISGRNLRNGTANSCGCMRSAGEQVISQILNKHHIKFTKEYTFNNLRSYTGSKLRFDFCLFNEDGSINTLIEFQGPQHFKDTGFYKDVDLKTRQEYDQLKEEYCAENKLKLLSFIYGDKSPIKQKEEIETKILYYYNENIKEKNKNGKISYICL